jgi:hypothetical protein
VGARFVDASRLERDQAGYLLQAERGNHLLLFLQLRDFEVRLIPGQECVDAPKPGVDRDRRNSPGPQLHDAAFDRGFGLEGTVERLKGVTVPC